MPALTLPCLVVSLVLAADPAKPHPHQGILPAYDGPPPRMDLSAADLAVLARGEPVKHQLKQDDGGRGVAVQDIHATTDVVWGRILDLEAYPRMVDNVHEVEVYRRSGHHIYARFVIGALLLDIEYYIDHICHQEEGWMTWRLDYSRDSDLDDSVGFWRIEAIDDKPGWTRVTYSVEVRPEGWVPEAIEDLVTDRGLTKATAWVKRESEAAAASGK